MDDESWLNFFQWVSILAIVISLISQYFGKRFSDRVNTARRIEIANSNKVAAESNAVAANANKRAEELHADNLQLGLQLEKERQARLQIERQLAPRFLSSDEQKIIAEGIRPYPGHEIIVSGVGDPEAEFYAEQFAKLFEAAKWQVERVHGAFMGPAQYGLVLVIDKEPDQAVRALMSAVKKAGIKLKTRTDTRFTPAYVRLLVGDKDPTQTSTQ